MRTTTEKETLNREGEPQVKQNLEDVKPKREKDRDMDYRYECDSGVCFESGI
ncbi:MAG TPA: hypothetical protein VFG28_02010 [Syntrophales bacterium]|nr:hypothetical protein [Syntrophales bacterium]